MAEPFGEKSQEATPRRRQKAREEGHVAKSQDLASAVLLVAAVLVLMYFGTSVVEYLARFATRQLGEHTWQVADTAMATAVFHRTAIEMGRTLLPIMGLFMLLAIAAHVGQTGPLLVPKRLAPDADRINPIKGVQRLFAVSNLVRFLFGIFKVAVVTAVGVWSLWDERATILSLSDLEVLAIGAFLMQLAAWTSLKMGAALLVLAILDFAYQRWRHEQDLRMTPQEVREEMKTLQGDPQVTARRRAVQRQLVLNRLTNTVPGADLVVTNPTELSVALRYDPESMPTPVVVAKGAGILAQRIRRLALENGIPVVERKEMAQSLYKNVNQGDRVPPAQYAAVAEVLHHAWELQGKTLPEVSHAA